MEISRYASKFAPTSEVMPSGRPLQQVKADSERSAHIEVADSTVAPFRFIEDVPQEPEDARLTGGTRSLSRRLLALNFPVLSKLRSPSAKAPCGRSTVNPKARKAALSGPGLVA